MSQLKYRPEIDGLRAVAIILVLLFHFDLGVTGGFIGVDVFFVISGYLITSLILKEQERGEFRLSQFWARRIRRIYPASFVMVICTLAASYVILFPENYDELAQSAVSQQLMISNMFFWKKTGYFDGASDLKPLLHTWSLSVEEQFYLFYPVLLVSLNRFRRPVALGLLVILTIASFSLSAWGIYWRPVATFFLLPTRAWEMLIGGILCYLPAPLSSRRWVSEMMSMGGGSLIVAAALLFNSGMMFPGASALPPCLGTAFIIMANSDRLSIFGRLLASKPFVAVGLLSYSLYLWHWPVLALARHYFMTSGVGIEHRIAALGVAIVLAALTYFCLERPIRRRALFAETRRLSIASGIGAVAVVVASIVIAARDGIPQRFDPRALSYAASRHDRAFWHQMTPDDLLRGTIPVFGSAGSPIKCLIMGDSQAMGFVPGLDAACKAHGIAGFQVTHTSTAPLLNFVKYSNAGLNQDSIDFNKQAVDLAIKHKVQVVFLAGMWSLYTAEPTFETSLQQTIQQIRDAGIQVAIIEEIANQLRDVPLQLCAAVCQRKDVSKIGISVEDYLAGNREMLNVLSRCAGDGITILSPLPHFVDAAGVWRAEIDGISMYRDSFHLSKMGGLRLTPMFNKFLDELEMEQRISALQSPTSVITHREEIPDNPEPPSNQQPHQGGRSTP